ncbi:biosynthetic arginine decarboxylase [Alphaproteobacteria bacterium]|nr:biosynthetic arginine decarboxylase [Alphaproteobacteria bacterium]
MNDEDIYGINKWGNDILEILENGNIGLKNPFYPNTPPCDLIEIIKSLNERGISCPVLLRVTDYLAFRIEQINNSFFNAIKDIGYKGDYKGVFPVKVNQQAQVIDRIVEFGKKYHFGLEVGSKPELLIAIAHDLTSKSAIICNGIKDREFIHLAILSQKIGFKTILVLESPRELELIIKISKELNIRPLLGIRIKLTNKVSGNWSQSSGDRSAFGLSVEQVMEVIKKLKASDYLDCLILQHSHLGSQIPDIIEIRKATQEACRFFSEITNQGAPLEYLDLGGGLGVDYTGEHKSALNSINYSLDEYCTNIVETVKYELDLSKVAHPTIVTESGRACIASSSMLIFNILETTNFDSHKIHPKNETDHPLLKNMMQILEYLSLNRAQECLNDLNYYRDEIRVLFRSGQINLPNMAKTEETYLYIITEIKKVLASSTEITEELQISIDNMADIYHGNFSLFQSLPDVWAIDQLHPIAPIQKLNEYPDRRVVLNDITCDSDGIINKFVLRDGVSSTLPLHKIEKDEDYFLGVFYIGAYQETLGDLHNLFGDTNVVTIKLKGDGGYQLLHEQEGDTISEVLSYVEYEPKDIINRFKRIVEDAVRSRDLSLSERKQLTQSFKESISGYTYFEK